MFEHLDDSDPTSLSPTQSAAVKSRADRLRQRARAQRRALAVAAVVVAATGVGALAAETSTESVTAVADEGEPTTTVSTTAPETTTIVETTTAPTSTTEALPATTAAPALEPTCRPIERFNSPGYYGDPAYDEQGGWSNHEVAVEIRLDKSMIAPGEPLTIEVVTTNPTSETAVVWTSPIAPLTAIQSSEGVVVWHSSHVSRGQGGAIREIEIGAAGSHLEQIHWDSVACAGETEEEWLQESTALRFVELPPGSYRIDAYWLGHVAVPAEFEVRS